MYYIVYDGIDSDIAWDPDVDTNEHKTFSSLEAARYTLLHYLRQQRDWYNASIERIKNVRAKEIKNVRDDNDDTVVKLVD